MARALSNAPAEYVQVALFKSSGSTVLWTSTIPTELPRGLLSAALFTFNASRAISTALLPSPNSEGARANDVIVARCHNGHVLAGIPLDEEVWLGLFARGLPPLHNVDVSTLMARIALAVDTIAPVNDDQILKLDHFWCIVQQYMHQRRGRETERRRDTVTYIASLAGAPMYTRLSPKLQRKAYPVSIIDSIGDVSLCGACLFDDNEITLRMDGVSEAAAAVFVWSYKSFNEEELAHGKHEIKSGLLLRSWYTLSSFRICVLHSPSSDARRSDTELASLSDRVYSVLESAKRHYNVF